MGFVIFFGDLNKIKRIFKFIYFDSNKIDLIVEFT